MPGATNLSSSLFHCNKAAKGVTMSVLHTQDRKIEGADGGSGGNGRASRREMTWIVFPIPAGDRERERKGQRTTRDGVMRGYVHI